MLLEIAKPVALLLCILGLYGVFYTAFFAPATGMEQRIWSSLELISIWAAISLVSGLMFREREVESRDEIEEQWRAWRAQWSARERWIEVERQPEALLDTLPMQVFLWGTLVMIAMFVASWCLETYCIFYKDVHRF